MEPWRRLYVLSGLVWVPVLLLDVVLAAIFGRTREWTAINVTVVAVGLVVGLTCVVLGTVRRIKDLRKDTSPR